MAPITYNRIMIIKISKSIQIFKFDNIKNKKKCRNITNEKNCKNHIISIQNKIISIFL